MRAYNQRCALCGKFFTAPIDNPTTICPQCEKKKQFQAYLRKIIIRHPYMALGREMLVLLGEISQKIGELHLEANFKGELGQIQKIMERCRYGHKEVSQV